MEICAYCGEHHEPAEDAKCGCGCGEEPMGCFGCIQCGGPMPKFGPVNEDSREDVFRPEMVDDASGYDDREW